MKEIFDVYMENYHSARRLADLLYRNPNKDKIVLCTEKYWQNNYLEIEHEAYIIRIFKCNVPNSYADDALQDFLSAEEISSMFNNTDHKI